MATLSIINNFSLDSNGRTKEGKQGLAADAIADAYTALAVTGTTHYVEGVLATAAVATVYDDDDDLPADWDYRYFWADQICYIQIIGPTMNVIFKVAPYVPFVLPGYDSILAAANATPITGGAEPTLSDIDSVVIGNYSGNSMNYLFAVID
jgi:hypothetical protein